MTVRPSTSRPSSEIGADEAVARDDGRHEGRDAHEEGVDGQDLREKGGAAHRNGATVIGRSGPAV